MPIYEFQCGKGHIFEKVLPISECDSVQKCTAPRCRSGAERVYLPARTSFYLRHPIVIHRDSSGNFRFPGSADAKVPDGFERVELRTIPEIEKAEKDINRKLRSEAERHTENEDRYFNELRGQLRKELRSAMEGMSPLGRDFAMLAMAMNNRKTRRTVDPGGHFEILHFNQGNREEHRDKETGWKSRRA